MIEAPVHHPRSRWIGYLLRLCHTRVMRVFSHRIEEMKLTPRTYHILYLARLGGYNQNRLAAEIGTNQNVAGEIIKGLAEKKLVKQVANPSNRREKFIAITEDGMHLFALAEAVAAITQAQLLSGLTEAEQDELIRLLQKFVAATDQ